MNGYHQGRADPPAPRLGLHALSQGQAVLEPGGFPESPAGTGHTVPARPGLGTGGWGWPEHPELWARSAPARTSLC